VTVTGHNLSGLGAGAVLDLEAVTGEFTIQLIATDIFTDNSTSSDVRTGVSLEGSLDGENWYPLCEAFFENDSVTNASSVSGVGIASSSGVLARYLRADFAYLGPPATGSLTGNATVTVSAWIAAKL
jgi:hypothetical protein